MSQMGQGAGPPMDVNLPLTQPRTPMQNPSQGGFLDIDTQNRLRQLEMDKALAVQNEDYDQAKTLREQIERLKAVGMQLSSLDAQKQLAVQSENFDLAKRLKTEMD